MTSNRLKVKPELRVGQYKYQNILGETGKLFETMFCTRGYWTTVENLKFWAVNDSDRDILG